MRASMRVLLADDEKVYVESLAKILRRRGLDTVTVFDGPSATDAVSGGEFDVIVLDLRMPGMDGLTVLETIRSRDTLTPVILLTGHADLERVAKALKGGAVDVLLKPCPVDTLVAAIEDASERKVFAREVEGRQKKG
jgi:DNA-binding NtrC family response regulator